MKNDVEDKLTIKRRMRKQNEYKNETQSRATKWTRPDEGIAAEFR